MYGPVVSVEDQDVLLEIAPGVEVQFLRRAIMDVVPDPNEMEVPDTAPEEAETFDEAEDDAATGS
jgi:preprotein translocase subunit YajC